MNDVGRHLLFAHGQSLDGRAWKACGIGNALAIGAGVSGIQGRISSEGGEPFVDSDVCRLDLPAGSLSAAVTTINGVRHH